MTIIGNHIREHRTGALQGGQTGHGGQRPAINVARVEDILLQGNEIENVRDGAIARNHYSFAWVDGCDVLLRNVFHLLQEGE